MGNPTPADQQPVPRRGLGYGGVFILLALITAAEIGLSTSQMARSLRTGLFLLFSLAKAAFVAAYYMHLRRDSRLYLYIFVAPVILLLVFALVAAVP